MLTLMVTGVVILMAHPRLYWGETGNDLTRPWIELPISRNYRHGGWTNTVPFQAGADAPVSSSRTYAIFNQNSWGRSLHFLAGWFLVLPGMAYGILGLASGHFRRQFLPRRDELSRDAIVADVRDHLRLKIRTGSGDARYGLLQKCTYLAVVFLLLPLVVASGLAMSPAITAEYPVLSDLFGGMQSARSIHCIAFGLMMLFVGIHLVMVILSGFRRQMVGMTLGG